MKNIILLIFVFIFSNTNTFSQKETNIWFFGNNVGLDFSFSPPKLLTDSKLSSVEGCATISNNKGELLFYTDGLTIWNKKHNVMDGGSGLEGKPSSTQTGLSVQSPKNENEYYVFSIPEVESSDKACYYSIVDMSRNNGEGEVTTKNVLLDNPTTEKITARKHCNGKDVWIILHGEGIEYKAFLLSENGLSHSPVISNGLLYFNINSWASSGYMKFSSQGNMIATCHRESSKVELGYFNSETGVISNFFEMTFSMLTYGVEFSPSENYLYVSCGTSSLTGELFQVSLKKDDFLKQTQIMKSNVWYGALQLAPDSSIYLAKWNSNYLGVIKKPEIMGLGCDFMIDGVYLGKNTSTLGLPTFLQSYLPQRSGVWNEKFVCYGDTTTLINEYDSSFYNYSWSPSEGLSSTFVSNPRAFPTQSTKYKVVITKNGCFVDSTSVDVNVVNSANNILKITIDDNATYKPGEFVNANLIFPLSKSCSIKIDYDPECLQFVQCFSNSGKISCFDNLNYLTVEKFSDFEDIQDCSLSFKVLLPQKPPLHSKTQLRITDFNIQSLCKSVVIDSVSVFYNPTCAWSIRGVKNSGQFGLKNRNNSVFLFSGTGGKVSVDYYSLKGESITKFEINTSPSSEYDISLHNSIQKPYMILVRNGVWHDELLIIE